MAEGSANSGSEHLLLVLTNPVEGREAEFNDWYSNQHLGDLLRMPGVIAARRYALGDKQRMEPPYPYRYCALYEIETADIAAVMAELGRRARTPEMPMSDAMAPGSLVLYFAPITPWMREPTVQAHA